ncbi:hypothetical protein [Neomesorhizobium albiziae]|uniref:hypothetical protein n=1 Tax=Neomesorhizobium albiziae TaxID=335020 RepID=UPI001AEE0901|nr:hypothetical protein [Mesorhizobium albiziae]GLS31386.1 hypothetical protein GCM10007937_30960 [Mesorhizobium albiziae]
MPAHLLGKLPKSSRGKDIHVETTMGDLLAGLTGDACFAAVKCLDLGSHGEPNVELLERT